MKPLLITDCDEVLLHMVRHFGTWLAEAHAIDFALSHHDMAGAMRNADGTLVGRERLWDLLGGFFPREMGRQTLVPHAREALLHLSSIADVVILTNLGDHCRQARTEQLATHGIEFRVECNQGGKGPPVARLVEEHGPSVTVFVDDLATHHESVAEHARGVHRLHMIQEPELARRVPQAPHAHARIDGWREATRWIEDRFTAGRAADA